MNSMLARFNLGFLLFCLGAGVAAVAADEFTLSSASFEDNGKLAVPACPRVFHEAFLAGTEPVQICDLHR